MTLFKLNPYAKAVVAALVSLLTLLAQLVQDGSFDSTEITTVLGGIAATYAVFKTKNKPAQTKSPVEPSAHTATVYEAPTSVQNVASLAAASKKSSKASAKPKKKSSKKTTATKQGE